jgi:hypothetical protein
MKSQPPKPCTLLLYMVRLNFWPPLRQLLKLRKCHSRYFGQLRAQIWQSNELKHAELQNILTSFFICNKPHQWCPSKSLKFDLQLKKRWNSDMYIYIYIRHVAEIQLLTNHLCNTVSFRSVINEEQYTSLISLFDLGLCLHCGSYPRRDQPGTRIFCYTSGYYISFFYHD